MRLALIAALSLARPALGAGEDALAKPSTSRPVSPRSGGFEIGGAGFFASQEGHAPPSAAGPLLHIGVRLPASESVLIGLVGRLGTTLGPDGGPTSSITMDGRWMFGDLDLAPFISGGVGVLFRALAEAGTLRDLSQRPDLAFPLGLGLETRLGDELMLGFSLRYTIVATDLDRTVGPLDATICFVFL